VSVRNDYVSAIVRDFLQILEPYEFQGSDEAQVLAALIIADAINGLRKALIYKNAGSEL